MKKITVLLAAMVALASHSVHAGEVLRLKAVGTVKSESLEKISLRNFENSSEIFLVQWKSSVKESEKEDLTRLGLTILGYVPDDAFLVQGTPTQALNAEQLEFVHSVNPFTAPLKMEPELGKLGVFAFAQKEKVSLQLAPGADREAIFALLEQPAEMGGEIVTGTSQVGDLWKLASRGDVVWIERFLSVRSMEVSPAELGVKPGLGSATRTGYESGTKVINVDSFYGRGMTGQGQVVAVADTGLDTGDMNTLLADFQGQVKSGLAVGLGGKSWGDPMMHGTHVSGSILGNGRASDNLIRGGAYSAKLVMLGMWSDIMNNIMPPTLTKLFDAGYNEGARIQSNSWGAPGSNGRYDNMAVLADSWTFAHPDYLVMFAAGNDGADLNRNGVIDEGTVSSPGTAKNVLTVGASKNLLREGGIQKPMRELRDGMRKWGVEPLAESFLSDDIRGMAAFSSRGPTADGRFKPEIVAPGTNIVSARDKHPKADPATMSWGVYDDNYVFMGGTSMATPVAAGALALTRQFLVQKLGTESVSSALMKATIANLADDLFPGQFGERASGQEQPTRRPNNHQGWGRVNMANFMANGTLQTIDDAVGLATGATKSFTVQATAAQPLHVTLAYTDAPGVASAQRTLVNDLDLTVTDPSGKTIFPNGRAEKDSINNMEQVDVFNPVAGTYTVTVRAANVPQGKNGAQPFALVISSSR